MASTSIRLSRDAVMRHPYRSKRDRTSQSTRVGQARAHAGAPSLRPSPAYAPKPCRQRHSQYRQERNAPFGTPSQLRTR